MADWNLGSCANAIQNIVPNIPISISGAQLLDKDDRRRLYVEDYTGLTIGSVGIITRFQPALINFAIADLLKLMHLGGGDTSIGEVRLGRSALDSADRFEQMGIKELQRLGIKSTVSKVFG